MDFLFVLIELFSLCVTAEALRAKSIENQCFCRNGVSLAYNFRYNGSSPTNHSSCLKTRIIDLSYVIKMWAQVSYAFYYNARV